MEWPKTKSLGNTRKFAQYWFPTHLGYPTSMGGSDTKASGAINIYAPAWPCLDAVYNNASFQINGRYRQRESLRHKALSPGKSNFGRLSNGKI